MKLSLIQLHHLKYILTALCAHQISRANHMASAGTLMAQHTKKHGYLFLDYYVLSANFFSCVRSTALNLKESFSTLVML